MHGCMCSVHVCVSNSSIYAGMHSIYKCNQMSYQHICDKMDDYLEEFLFTKSKLTQIHYTSDLRHFRRWLKQANIPEDVRSIRFLDVQRYLKTLPESSSTRRRIIALKSFFHYLHLNDYITKDILKCLKVPVASKCRVERKLTQEEVHAILKKAKGKTKLLVCCLFFLGLRVSEALKLKKRDVKHGERLSVSVMGKGNKPRDVIAGKATSSFIWKQIEDLQGEDYLFSHRKSHHSRWWAQRRLKKLNPKISPHWLRHAFCSLSIQNGCDVGTVSISMGHTSLATTRRYCHSAEKPPGEYLERFTSFSS